MRREWVFGLAVIGCAVLALLIWAWNDAGREPVRSLSAPAVVPGAGQ